MCARRSTLTNDDFHTLGTQRGFDWIGKSVALSNEPTLWKCRKSKFHKWRTSYTEIKRGKGCPFCPSAGSGRRPCPDFNLATERPLIAELWHPTKNDKNPTEYLPGSNKIVWWQCPKNALHEWEAQINSLANGQGCPYCAGKRVCADNCLAFVEPDVAKQWHPTKNKDTPNDLTAGSGQKRWWRCKFGHEWKAMVATRSRGSGCPKCFKQSSKLELRVYCELDAILDQVRWRDKHLGKEIDVYLHNQKIGIEIDYVYTHQGKVKLDRDKNKLASDNGITLIRIRESKLKALSDNDILFKKSNSEKSIVMRLAAKLHDLVEEATDKEKIRNYIFGNRLIATKGFKKIFASSPAPPLNKSLEFLYPHLKDEWDYQSNHPLLPNMFTPGSAQKIDWRCQKCGEKWRATIAARTGSATHEPSGCPSCAGIRARQSLTSRNRSHLNSDYNLLISHPNIAAEYHPTKNLRPVEEVAPNTGTKVWWRCSNGHEWQQPIATRTRTKKNDSGCPICRSVKVARPELASEWDANKNKDTPRDVTVGSHAIRWWKCLNGHPSYQAAVYSRLEGTGCRTCGYQKNVNAGQQRRKEIIEEVNQIKAKGITSLREIANKLNARGLETPRGKTWNADNLYQILRRG